MAVLVVVSVGTTYAVTQSIVDHPNGPVGALMTGNVKITQFDGEGNIIAYRQTSNNIVDTGMDLIIRQVFADINATTAGWGDIIKSAMEEVETPKPEPETESEPSEEEADGNVIEVKISDGVGSRDR